MRRVQLEQYAIATSKRGKPYFIYLAACHVNHDKGNPQPTLRCLCISCHSRFDYQRKQREARIRIELLKHLRLLIEQGMVEVKYFL
jgi:hypothetical protein